ncbi:MAG: purine-binding chemotaxis protein CheW [Spirochaetes bacterium]|nr:MAG: purine-binding chemotaxis protein CheW [Spirochaetota bacterium]
MGMTTREEKKAAIDERQYITFDLMGESYGIQVLEVQEIVGMQRITHVPHSMPFMKGVINLRGIVVPLVDLRIKFGLPAKGYDKINVIMVVQSRGTMIGIIVDAVSDVVNLAVDAIQDTVHFSVNIDTDYIRGIAEKNSKLIIILDVEKIFTADELRQMAE